MAAKKQKLFNVIMMSCGFAESNQTSWLMYGTGYFGHPGFKTRAEAVTELALDLYAKYHDEVLDAYERRYSKKECCREALISNKNANFCPTCGSTIADRVFDPQEFRDFVIDLHGTTCDSYGAAEWFKDRKPVFWPWSVRDFQEAHKDQVIWIPENAEHVILAALYDVKPELKPVQDDYEIDVSDEWETLKNNKPLRVW